VSTYVEARPAPSAELRTSLGLATLAAALTHVMSASHAVGGVWPTGLPNLVMALLLGVVAAGLAFSAARWVTGPAAAVNAMIALVWISTHVRGLPIGLPDLIGTAAELVAAGGAIALLCGCGDRTLSIWSKVALAFFALAAFSGFGHVGH
jgi:hypothetical protein